MLERFEPDLHEHNTAEASQMKMEMKWNNLLDQR